MNHYKRGRNPGSHGNRRIPSGVLKQIILTGKQWSVAALIGTGNQGRGVRTLLNPIEQDFEKTALILGAKSSSLEEIRDALLKTFPEIDGGKKNSVDLLREIAQGESCLVRDEQGISRLVKVAGVEILHGFQSLVEEKQVIFEPTKVNEEKKAVSVGQEVRRGLSGVREKIKRGETPLETAKRGIQEEIGNAIGVEFSDSDFITLASQGDSYVCKNEIPSSYKGIDSRILIYPFAWQMPSEFYRSGYRTVEKNRMTYFKWSKSELNDC